MQCFEKRESENMKERRKIYAARDFSDKSAVIAIKHVYHTFMKWRKTTLYSQACNFVITQI
jgi:hypothetical protein